MHRDVRVFCFICITLSTSVCNANADQLHEKSKVSNYFLHAPYGANTYAFGFEIKDPSTGNRQFRDERRYLNGSIDGSFGYVRPDGRITVTHFSAANQTGYHSQTQTFAADDAAALAQHWPTSKPAMLAQQLPTTTEAAAVNWDAASHLNVSATQVADNLTHMLQATHGIDLNHIDIEHDLLQPAILDIVSGKVPLQEVNANGTLGYETVHNFIPPEFPIVPFQPPAVSANASGAVLPVVSPAPSKYDKAKANNAEKSPQTQAAARLTKPHADATKPTQVPPTPAPLADSDADVRAKSEWYEQIIADSRKEFLDNLPPLHQIPEEK